jgi:hypothetical protein
MKQNHNSSRVVIPSNFVYWCFVFVFRDMKSSLETIIRSFSFDSETWHKDLNKGEVFFFFFFFLFCVLCFQFCFWISEHRGESECISLFWSWNVCQQSWHELTECSANTEWIISLRSYVNDLSVIGSSERSILFSLKHWVHSVIIKKVNESFPYNDISSVWIDWD